ncbi:MAG: flagellar hook-length control protein FliK, partial [Bradyrhizobium sp.]|nr:flagellar hook-length control protein FliK [Bradyrhizobium sp.]
AAAAPSAAAPATTAAAAPAAQIAVAAPATAATAAVPPAPQEPAPMVVAAATDTAPTLAVAATAPVQPKITPLKELAAAPAKAPASVASDTTAGTANPSATTTPAGMATSNTIAQQPTGTAKPETGTGIVDTGKPDDSAGPGSTAAAAKPGDDRSPVAGTAQPLTASSDPGAQTNATIQPPLSSAATQAAPVVPPLTVTAAINAPVPLSGLALELAASARSGKSRFEIRLDPADLGRIDVRIDVDRNGQVTSHLRVEKPETLSMLRQDAPQLQRALDDAGFKTGNGGLQFSLRDQSSSGQNSGNETGRNAQRLVVSEEDTIPAALAGRTYGRVLGSSSGVDISV